MGIGKLLTKSTSTTSPEVTTKPTRDEVIDRILAEARAADQPYTRDDAEDLVAYMIEVGFELAEYPGDPHYFSQEFLDRHHEVLDEIMPDNFVSDGFDALPGSAYAGLNAVCLVGDQLTFEHIKARRGATEHCAAHTRVRVV